MINGPESFTPDGNFILGAAPECANMFVGAGFNAFGIASGGGAGWVLADVGRDRRGADGPLGRRHPPLLRHAPRPRLGEGADARGLRQALHHRLPARGIPVAAASASSPRSTSGSRRTARCSAQSSAGSGPTGSRRRASRRRTSIRWAGRTGSSRSATSIGWCARRSASSTSRRSPSTRSPAAAPSRR